MLTSVQERALVELMGSRANRPVFPRDLPERLAADLARGLEPALAGLPDGGPLRVTKARLSDIHSRCEGLFLAHHLSEGGFELGPAAAVGALVHKAVEISVHAGRLSEPELVTAALERLAQGDPAFRTHLATLTDADVSLLVGEAVRRVTLFQATLPPLLPGWTPAVELPLRFPLCGGRVVLSARPDLVLGGPDPEEPGRARRLILELKTGAERPEHDDDLRFYALVATLRLGVPPFRVATVMLEDGSWRFQDVSEDLLEAAIRRVVAGVSRAAELLSRGAADLRPGPWCGWCPRRATCPEAAGAGS